MTLYNFLRKNLITGVCLCVLAPVTVISAADATTTVRNTTLPASTDSSIKKEVSGHMVHGIIVVDADYFPSSASKPDARCKKSELTQEKFLEMLHTIAMHGDLTDIPFIEKTLGVKFASPHDFLGGTRYDIDSYYDTQIKISITSYENNRKDWNYPSSRSALATISFYGLDKSPSNFQNCNYLIKDKFDQRFARYSIQTDELTSVLGPAIKDPKTRPVMVKQDRNQSEVWARGMLNDVVGKYNATTEIECHFNKTTKVITSIDIDQTVAKKLSNSQ